MRSALLFFTILLTSAAGFAQIPIATNVQILAAEDARNYDALKPFIFSKNITIQSRAVLAAGRIGDASSVDALAAIMEKGDRIVKPIAAFAIGETEADQAAVFVIRALNNANGISDLRARAVEAAGKIAAANPKSQNAKLLGEAIIRTLQFENAKRSAPSVNVIRLALTAALRAKPEGADEAIKPFLGYSDPAIVTDALNTLTRLRAKNAGAQARALLSSSKDPMVRAGAARLLGASEDIQALDLLIKTAVSDEDLRVRVSSIRSLGSLKDIKAVERLLDRGDVLLEAQAASKYGNPIEKNELLEIATTLGRLLPDTDNSSAVEFLSKLRLADKYSSPETEIAFARIAAERYLSVTVPDKLGFSEAWTASAYAQGLSVIAESKDEELRSRGSAALISFIAGLGKVKNPRLQAKLLMAMPELTRTLAKFKPDNLDTILRGQLENQDIFLRTAAAELIAEQPVSKENVDALKKAFSRALIIDKQYDDAQLAIMDALTKLDKKASVGTLLTALNATDYLVRKKAFALLDDEDLKKDFPGIEASIEAAEKKHLDQVLPHTPVFGTRLGQVLNSNADYRRALSRKNGSVKAILTTEKGAFTIDLLPGDAPLTVDNFVKLARARYFDGLEVHRVVPNFVMQDGDPRGDGNGGPGWSIRCEINMVPYERGAVGMALSGKDTGGSQWFVTHSPQPHLDGGYTGFGNVNETGMSVVDNIVRGDKIITVRIIGN